MQIARQALVPELGLKQALVPELGLKQTLVPAAASSLMAAATAELGLKQGMVPGLPPFYLRQQLKGKIVQLHHSLPTAHNPRAPMRQR